MAARFASHHSLVDGPSALVVGNGTTAAKLRLSDGGHSFADGLIISTSGVLSAYGTITGDITNHGVLGPGDFSQSTLTLNGALTNTGLIKMELNTSNFIDRIVVSGTFDAGGQIAVILDRHLVPAIGATYDLMDFASIIDNGYTFDFTSALLPNGRRWDISQFPIDGTIRVVAGVTGDFSGDGKVDSADYVMWRKGLRATYTASDYATWHQQFGTSSSSSAELDASQVPEPAMAGFLFSAAIGVVLRRRKRVSPL
jgi:hypothetical protein